MKKILEVNVDDMGFGGVYSLVRNVILAKPAGTTLDIACIEPFEQQKNIDELADRGCMVHYVGYAGNKVKKQFVIIQNLKILIREGGYEAVHIHGDVAYKLLVYSVAARLSGVKTILLHSHASGTDGNHRDLKRKLHMASRRFLKWTGTGYVSCSDLAADWMFPNVKANKITIIHNGVDLDKFRFDPENRAAVRNAWGLEDAFVLGHVGRFEYQKNHEYLVDIFEAVKQREACRRTSVRRWTPSAFRTTSSLPACPGKWRNSSPASTSSSCRPTLKAFPSSGSKPRRRACRCSSRTPSPKRRS